MVIFKGKLRKIATINVGFLVIKQKSITNATNNINAHEARALINLLKLITSLKMPILLIFAKLASFEGWFRFWTVILNLIFLY